ncbi:hypothetical protein ACFXAZ_26085 [Streptomyces sp. NPDC059477]|uniref:hypothetical protein n=1 Tax=Streptomyces sp. NPDC059477 TaxID=3346847 RepID=UPI00369031B5
MICQRCGKPIKPGEPYDQLDNPGASRGGCTIYLHQAQCPNAYTRTYPEGRRP